MRKYYKLGNRLLDEEVLRAHRIIEIDGQFVALTASKFDAGSPENANRAFDAIARLLGAEDLLALGADEGGDEKIAARVVSEAPAAEKKDDPWKPNDGERYSFLDDGGDIFATTFCDDSRWDRVRVAFGNCFRTREEAEAKRAEIFS